MVALTQSGLVAGAMLVVGCASWLFARLCTVRKKRPFPRALLFWLLGQGYLVYGLWWIGALVAPSRGLAVLTVLALGGTVAAVRLARHRPPARTWGVAIGSAVPWILGWVVAIHAGG